MYALGSHWVQSLKNYIPGDKQSIQRGAAHILGRIESLWQETYTPEHLDRLLTESPKQLRLLNIRQVESIVKNRDFTDPLLSKLIAYVAQDELRLSDLGELLLTVKKERGATPIAAALEKLPVSVSHIMLQEIMSKWKSGSDIDDLMQQLTDERRLEILTICDTLCQETDGFLQPLAEWLENRLRELNFDASAPPLGTNTFTTMGLVQAAYKKEMHQEELEADARKDAAAVHAIRLEKLRHRHETRTMPVQRTFEEIDFELSQALAQENVTQIDALMYEAMVRGLSDPAFKRCHFSVEKVHQEWTRLEREGAPLAVSRELYQKEIRFHLCDQLQPPPPYHSETSSWEDLVRHLQKSRRQKELSKWMGSLRQELQETEAVLSKNHLSGDAYEESACQLFKDVLEWAKRNKLLPLQRQITAYLRDHTRHKWQQPTFDLLLQLPGRSPPLQAAIGQPRIFCLTMEYKNLLSEIIRNLEKQPGKEATRLWEEAYSLQNRLEKHKMPAHSVFVRGGLEGQKAILRGCQRALRDKKLSYRAVHQFLKELLQEHLKRAEVYRYDREAPSPFAEVELAELLPNIETELEKWINAKVAAIDVEIGKIRERATLPFDTTANIAARWNTEVVRCNADNVVERGAVCERYQEIVRRHIASLKWRKQVGTLTVRCLESLLRCDRLDVSAVPRNWMPLVEALRLQQEIRRTYAECRSALATTPVAKTPVAPAEPDDEEMQPAYYVLQVFIESGLTADDLFPFQIPKWDIPALLKKEPTLYARLRDFAEGPRFQWLKETAEKKQTLLGFLFPTAQTALSP